MPTHVVESTFYEGIAWVEVVLCFDVDDEFERCVLWRRCEESNVVSDTSLGKRRAFVRHSLDATGRCWICRIAVDANIADFRVAFDVAVFDVLNRRIFKFGDTRFENTRKHELVGE